MTNQLTAAVLADEVRAAAEQLRNLLGCIDSHITEQHHRAKDSKNIGEMQRLNDAEPFKWLESAKTNLQTGIMHALRSVDQPTGF